MFNIIQKGITWNGKDLSIETGKIARQADGSVIVRYGSTVILSTVVIAKEDKADIDFVPLTVHFLEKSYAAGKIPSGFIKRETKPSNYSVLVSRLIDRSIRPLFKKDFRREIQVVTTILSHDPSVDFESLAIIASVAAVIISGAELSDIVAGIRVGYLENSPVIYQNNMNNRLDMIISASRESIFMVESGASELSKGEILNSIDFGCKNLQPVLQLLEDFKNAVGKNRIEFPDYTWQDSVYNKIEEKFAEKVGNAYKISDKKLRQNELSEVKSLALQEFTDEENHITQSLVSNLFKELEKKVVRKSMIATKKRIDGRSESDIRKIEIETGLLPETHGSALFTRGETQALVVATLGMDSDGQISESIFQDNAIERFMLQYNFPPYAVGEIGRMGAPGRREIGHGNLAFRAIESLVPKGEEMPYTIRLVSEITESNGSSSMATVCGGSLALMDAGIKIKSPVAGIAMGLIKEGEDVMILSDILGDEDYLGDMDFKVAGTKNGITAMQMDIKISGISRALLERAIDDAEIGVNHILSLMSVALPNAKENLSKNAPKIKVINVDPSKLGLIFGSGGKTIKSIIAKFSAIIDVSDDGVVKISAKSDELIDGAIDAIKSLAFEPKLGKIYKGHVVKILENVGAFVNIGPNVDGFVHISELDYDFVGDIKTVIDVNDEIFVKVIEITEDKSKRDGNRLKIKLSYRAVDQETGNEVTDKK